MTEEKVAKLGLRQIRREYGYYATYFSLVCRILGTRATIGILSVLCISDHLFAAFKDDSAFHDDMSVI